MKKRRPVEPRACLICGKTFKPRDNMWPGKYCSGTCRGIAQRHDPTKTEVERNRERSLANHYADPEKAKTKRKAQYWSNRQKAIDDARQWREQNPDKYRENQRQYKYRHYRENREQYNTYVRNRRARLKQAEGVHAVDDIQRQYQTQEGKCYWCGVDLNGIYHVDHYIPVSRGGSNWPLNLVIACPHCNESRNDRLPDEWKPIK